MYEHVLKHAYLPLVERYKRIDHRGWLAEAERNQYLTPAALRALQLEKLQAIVAHAGTHCPFYRERFDTAGVRADAVRSLDDFRRIPLLSKEDVRVNAERMASPVYHGRLVKAVTSGSLGLSLRFELDSEQEGWTFVCWDRGHRWWGVNRWDRRLTLWGRPITGRRAALKSWAVSRAHNTMHFNTFVDLDDQYLARVVHAVETFRPRYILAYGSSVGPLADYMNRKRITFSAKARPAFVEYTGDSVYATEKEAGERVFGAPVVPFYGSGEAGGLANTCPRGKLHMSPDHTLIEFLRDDGTPADPGEQAEIVVTTLHNRRMPMIRYRLGDLGSYTDEPCECGVKLPVMNLEVAKVLDRITTSSKKVVSSIVLDFINKQLLRDNVRGIRQFLVEQTGLDTFILHIVRDEPFDERVIPYFIGKMKEYLGERIEVKVTFVNAVPVSASGKRRWFKKSGEWASPQQ